MFNVMYSSRRYLVWYTSFLYRWTRAMQRKS